MVVMGGYNVVVAVRSFLGVCVWADKREASVDFGSVR
jgi:hypothetical protein